MPCGAKTCDFLCVTSFRLDMVDKQPQRGTLSSALLMATASSHAPAIKLESVADFNATNSRTSAGEKSVPTLLAVSHNQSLFGVQEL